MLFCLFYFRFLLMLLLLFLPDIIANSPCRFAQPTLKFTVFTAKLRKQFDQLELKMQGQTHKDGEPQESEAFKRLKDSGKERKKDYVSEF